MRWHFTGLMLLAICVLYSSAAYTDSDKATTDDTATIIDIDISSEGYALIARQTTLEDVLYKLSTTADFKLKAFTNINKEPADWQFHPMPLSRLLDNLTRGYSTVMLYEEKNSKSVNSSERKVKELWLVARENDQVAGEKPGVNIEIKLDQDNAQFTESKSLTPEQQYEISFIDNLEGMTGGDIVDTLQQTLSAEDDPLVRKRAIIALGDIGGVGVLDALESGMGDASSEVRTELAKTLAKIKDQRSMLLLGQILMGDQNSQVRQQAVHALYQQNSPAARSFVETAAADKDPAVKKIASDILQQWAIAPGEN